MALLLQSRCSRYTAPPTRARGFCWVHFAHFGAPCSLQLSNPTPGMSTEYGYCVFTGHLTGGIQKRGSPRNHEGEGLGGSGYGGLCPDPCRKPLELSPQPPRHTPDPGIPPVLDLLRWLVRVKGTLHPESDAVVRGTGIWRMYLLGLEGWLRTSDPPHPFAAATPTADCRPQTAVQCGPGVLDVVSSRLRPNVSCRQRRRQPANPPLGTISQCSRRPLLFLLRLLF